MQKEEEIPDKTIVVVQKFPILRDKRIIVSKINEYIVNKAQMTNFSTGEKIGDPFIAKWTTIPKNAILFYHFGTIMAVASDVSDDIKVGKHVMFETTQLVDMLVNNEPYILLYDHSIFAFIDESEIHKIVSKGDLDILGTINRKGHLVEDKGV